MTEEVISSDGGTKVRISVFGVCFIRLCISKDAAQLQVSPKVVSTVRKTLEIGAGQTYIHIIVHEYSLINYFIGIESILTILKYHFKKF